MHAYMQGSAMCPKHTEEKIQISKKAYKTSPGSPPREELGGIYETFLSAHGLTERVAVFFDHTICCRHLFETVWECLEPGQVLAGCALLQHLGHQ